MLCKVTHCTGHGSVSTRPHQLPCGDWLRWWRLLPHAQSAVCMVAALNDLRVIVAVVVIPSLVFGHALLKLFTNFIATVRWCCDHLHQIRKVLYRMTPGSSIYALYIYYYISEYQAGSSLIRFFKCSVSLCSICIQFLVYSNMCI